MTKFDKCPRCLTVWNQNYYCDKCNLLHNLKSGNIILFQVLESLTDYLTWLVNDNICIYHYIILNSKHEIHEIRLPYLPYDVTKEKLKMYLRKF